MTNPTPFGEMLAGVPVLTFNPVRTESFRVLALHYRMQLLDATTVGDYLTIYSSMKENLLELGIRHGSPLFQQAVSKFTELGLGEVFSVVRHLQQSTKN